MFKLVALTLLPYQTWQSSDEICAYNRGKDDILKSIGGEIITLV